MPHLSGGGGGGGGGEFEDRTGPEYLEISYIQLLKI